MMSPNFTGVNKSVFLIYYHKFMSQVLKQTEIKLSGILRPDDIDLENSTSFVYY